MKAFKLACSCLFRLSVLLVEGIPHYRQPVTAGTQVKENALNFRGTPNITGLESTPFFKAKGGNETLLPQKLYVYKIYNQTHKVGVFALPTNMLIYLF